MSDKPKKKLGTMSAMLPKNVTKIIQDRVREKIPTKIVADDPMFIPQYQRFGDACCDLKVNLNRTDAVVQPDSGFPNGQLTIPPGATVKIDCGFSMEIPPGYEAQIRSRSGWASKGLIVSNGIGTVEETFRGRIAVILTNTTQEYFFIGHGERIAQMCIKPVYYFDFIEAENLSDTERGVNGFGSSGVK